MTSQLDIAKVFESLGRLTESVEGLRRDLGDFERATGENRSLIKNVAARVEEIDREVKEVKSDLEHDVLPTIAKVRIWEQRGIGALAAVGMVGTALGAVLAAFVWKGWEKLSKFLGG